MFVEHKSPKEREEFDELIGMTGNREVMPDDDEFIPAELRGKTAPSWWKGSGAPDQVVGSLKV